MSEDGTGTDAGTQTNDGAAAAAQLNGAGDGGAPETWYSGFAPEHQEIVTKNGWNDKTPEDVVKAYGQLNTLLGNRDMDGYLKLPEGEEKWDDVWNRLGRPETADQYTNVEIPEGHAVKDDPTGDQLKTAAHNLGLSDKQYAGLMEWYYSDFSPAMAEAKTEAYNADIDRAERELREEWGTNFPEKVAQNEATLKALGWDGDLEADLNEVLGAKRTAALLQSLAPLVMSDTGPLNGAGGFDQVGGQRNESWAQAEKNKLMADDEFMTAVRTNTLDLEKHASKIERWNNANAILSGAR